MESELDHDVEESSKAVDEGRPGSALRRGGGEWDLSPGTARAGNESFQEVAQVVKHMVLWILLVHPQDFKDTFAMNITKLAQERGEAIYATVKKKKSVSFLGVECVQFLTLKYLLLYNAFPPGKN